MSDINSIDLEQARAEGYAAGVKAGAKAERERIQQAAYALRMSNGATGVEWVRYSKINAILHPENETEDK